MGAWMKGRLERQYVREWHARRIKMEEKVTALAEWTGWTKKDTFIKFIMPYWIEVVAGLAM